MAKCGRTSMGWKYVQQRDMPDILVYGILKVISLKASTDTKGQHTRIIFAKTNLKEKYELVDLKGRETYFCTELELKNSIIRYHRLLSTMHLYISISSFYSVYCIGYNKIKPLGIT